MNDSKNIKYFFSSFKCNSGWQNTGLCCCNCKNQIELFKHPWNTINKGPCSESTNFYVCILQHNINKDNRGTLFEFKHGFCEMHKSKFKTC